ncbi:helix-turn-helix transcriptional regulator [Kitasatospora terrestris]|uniref:AraC family transcriptional regulator n=1 Tax=Kitasatospora terrestris TaxID=258051 RepID=A0ABP9EFB6_9ACTN
MNTDWRLVRGRPGPALADAVLGYRAFDLTLDRVQRRLEVPVGAVTLVANLGRGTLRIGRPGESGDWSSADSFAVGPRTRAVIGEHNGVMRGIEVNLTSWFARTVLGVHLGELRDRQVELDQLLGRRWRHLEEQLAELPTSQARFTLLDRHLLRLRAAGPEPAPQLRAAWRHLLRGTTPTTVAALAHEVGWSPRSLELRFAEHIGLTPKSAARVTRLARTLRMLTAGHPLSTASTACGFYDQAHLNREFRALTGGTPREFLHHRRTPGRHLDRLPGWVTSALLP